MLMAGKTETMQAPPQKEVAETTDTLPLLDLSDAAVKTLISTAKKRGYVTHEQVKLLAEEVNSEQVEDVLAMFSEMGVNVVETEETTDEEEQERDEVEAEGRELVEVRQKVPAKSDAKAALPRRRNRHRQAYRGWARSDDRRAVRESPHLPSHHHLAR
jgi:RNA polymerase primary sigma factor